MDEVNMNDMRCIKVMLDTKDYERYRLLRKRLRLSSSELLLKAIEYLEAHEMEIKAQINTEKKVV